MVVDHSNPIVRANAARVLGATEDKESFDALLDRALHDDDLRVRVSAIRALGSLKDAKATESLLRRSAILLRQSHLTKANRPGELDELLEIVSTVGNLMRSTQSAEALSPRRSPQRSAHARACPSHLSYRNTSNSRSMPPTVSRADCSPPALAQCKTVDRLDQH